MQAQHILLSPPWLSVNVIIQKDSDNIGNATFEWRIAHIHSSKSVKPIHHFWPVGLEVDNEEMEHMSRYSKSKIKTGEYNYPAPPLHYIY